VIGRASSDTTGDVVLAAARAGEPDRYLAALLAPRHARQDLLALAAFAAELARIAPLTVREPAMGDIRLQWWRDALAAGEAGERTGHPVADAVRAAAARHRIARTRLEQVIDAHATDGLADPFPDDDALHAMLVGREGSLFLLAGQILGGAPPLIEATAHAAAIAYGLARLLIGLPQAAARSHVPLPLTRLANAGLSVSEIMAGQGGEKVWPAVRDLAAQSREHLARARNSVADLPREFRAAFLPLALVAPYLQAVERPSRNPLRDVAEIAPLRRVVGIAAAHWLGRS
jgi:15-cis-phytoene synthase